MVQRPVDRTSARSRPPARGRSTHAPSAIYTRTKVAAACSADEVNQRLA